MKKVKILHIQLFSLLSGVQKVALDELIHLDNDIFDKYLLCKEEGQLTEECRKNGIQVILCKDLVRDISFFKDMKAFLSFIRLMHHEKFDIVHTHSSKTGVLGRLAAKLTGAKFILHTVHGFSFPAASNFIQRNIFRLMEYVGSWCSDRLICLHEEDAAIAINYVGASRDKVIVLANGVDTSIYSPPDARKQYKEALGLRVDCISVGMVGRLSFQKNPRMLLEAAIPLLEKHDNIQFVFCGDGELRSELEELLVSNGINEKQIKLLGWVKDIPNVLKSLDIFVLPSKYEGMPLAILEAQSSALPCVVSNIQGNRDLVNNHFDGLLFELGDTKELLSHLSHLIANDEARLTLGNNARMRVMMNHCIKTRTEHIENLYLENLSRNLK
ncbi:glycosyltransferase family 4 protein [Vibrio sp. VGrn 2]|uniref:glycosyltransferase family 4 protein n=1 Tax=Vibrio sp. VGrn 2 TaxID=2419839 RepID=UPI001D0D36CE|nr:glycosyltransferase family 4 protein [Vibrio sp. VGrn 2]